MEISFALGDLNHVELFFFHAIGQLKQNLVIRYTHLEAGSQGGSEEINVSAGAAVSWALSCPYRCRHCNCTFEEFEKKSRNLVTAHRGLQSLWDLTILLAQA